MKDYNYLCKLFKTVNRSSIFLSIAYALKCFPIIMISNSCGVSPEIAQLLISGFISSQFNPLNGELSLLVPGIESNNYK